MELVFSGDGAFKVDTADYGHLDEINTAIRRMLKRKKRSINGAIRLDCDQYVDVDGVLAVDARTHLYAAHCKTATEYKRYVAQTVARALPYLVGSSRTWCFAVPCAAVAPMLDGHESVMHFVQEQLALAGGWKLLEFSPRWLCYYSDGSKDTQQNYIRMHKLTTQAIARPLLYSGPAWALLLETPDGTVLQGRVFVTAEGKFICSDWCQRDSTDKGNGISLQVSQYTLAGWCSGPGQRFINKANRIKMVSAAVQKTFSIATVPLNNDYLNHAVRKHVVFFTSSGAALLARRSLMYGAAYLDRLCILDSMYRVRYPSEGIWCVGQYDSFVVTEKRITEIALLNYERWAKTNNAELKSGKCANPGCTECYGPSEQESEEDFEEELEEEPEPEEPQVYLKSLEADAL